MPRKRVFFLAAIAAMTSLGIDMSLPGIPGIETELGARAGLGVLSATLFVAGFAAMPLIGGPLSDSFGRVRVLLVSLVCFVIAALGCASAHSMSTLLAFRLVQGCASGIATTLPLAIVGDSLAGAAGRQAMSEISALSGLMPIVAPAFGNWAIRSGGWRLLFGAQALFVGALAVLAIRFPESLAPTARRPLDPRNVLRRYRMLISEPSLRTHALVFGLLFACTFCFTAMSPLVLIQRLGMSRTTFALVMCVNAVGSMLGAGTSALLSKHHVSAQRIVLPGLALATTSSTIAAVFQWERLSVGWGYLAAVFLAFFGFNLAGPSLLLEALQYVPTLLGSASGLMRSIFMLMNSVASGLVGIYSARHLAYTERATMLLMAALALSATALYGSYLCRTNPKFEKEGSLHL
jgi:MFS transporter, DHA1 family, multidrug resistance protein